MFLHAASVFVLLMSKKSSTFAVDFKNNFAMCERFSTSLFFLLLVLLFGACSPTGPGITDVYPDQPFNPSWISSLSDKQRDEVFKDTITPPNNPMTEKPLPPGSISIRGKLTLEYFGDELYCAVRSVHNDYFLMDTQCTYLLRLDDPRLAPYAVGDTVVITAQPMRVVDEYALSTYYVQSK